MAGYTLGGTAFVNYSDMTFIAPLIVASAVDPQNQDFLDAGWRYMVNNPANNYFSESITLLSLFTISGNWWAPSKM